LLADGLRSRHAEIQEAILDHLHTMEADSPVRDAAYLKGLREAVSRGVDYGIEVLATGGLNEPTVPLSLIGQARLAARHGVSLDMVVRRLGAAKTLLADFLLAEADRIKIHDVLPIRDVIAVHEGAFNQMLTQATEEYEREAKARATSPGSRLERRVRRLLDGDPVDTTLLEYNLELNHLGLVALAPDVKPQLRQLATALGGRLLSVTVSHSEVWAWIGTGELVDPAEISAWASAGWPDSVPLGVGEPATGATGWRRSHAQAKAAAQIGAMSSAPVTRYREIALLASIGHDPLLSASLDDLYLRPLGKGKEGENLRKTLLAYFHANRNSKSAAAALVCSRQTVGYRLKTVAERLSQPLDDCGDLLHAALRLEALGFFESS
jgi:hypothetical protein